MDANIEISKLKNRRTDKLSEIIEILSKQINKIDDMNIILKKIDKIIEDVHKINRKIEKINSSELYDREYERKLIESIEKHHIFINHIQKQKERIYNSIEQTGKRNKVLQSYVGKSYNSIFVDKNL